MQRLLYKMDWAPFDPSETAISNDFKGGSCFLGFLDSGSAKIMEDKFSEEGMGCFLFDPEILDDSVATDALVARMSTYANLKIILESPQEGKALNLAKAFLKSGYRNPFLLCCLTHGVHNLPGFSPPLFPNGSALWGFARVLRNELPTCRVVMVDAAVEEFVPSVLFHNPLEFVFRENRIFTPNLIPVQEKEFPSLRPVRIQAGKGAFCLKQKNSGRLDGLYYQEMKQTNPTEGEVQIKVHATSLNLNDPIITYDFLEESEEGTRSQKREFRMECSGIVTKVGKGVRRFKKGDAVCGFASGAFSSHINLPQDVVCRVLPGTSMEETPTYIPFATAIYALHEIAQLTKGETVLIYSAGESVGVAAIQYARMLGANVIAAANHVESRRFLKEFGVEHVVDPNASDFLQRVQECTSGEGVKVIFRISPVDQINMTLLAPGGRAVSFLEGGMVEWRKKQGVKEGPVKVLDLSYALKENPKIIQKLLKMVVRYFRSGHFKPLPFRVFPAGKVEEAFKAYTDHREVEKVILRFEGESVLATPQSSCIPQFRSDASYLVTEGLGFIGIETAKWLATQGVKCLILTTHQEIETEKTESEVLSLRALGIRVETAKVDVSDKETLERYWKKVEKEFPVLKGIFHCAAETNEGTLNQINAETLHRSAYPKTMGCWNLHNLSKEMNLDHFVLFSSIDSLMGTKGRAASAAANAFLDAFAHYRKAFGLPVVAINLGPMEGEVRNEAYEAFMTKEGLKPIRPEETMEALAILLEGPAAQYAVIDKISLPSIVLNKNQVICPI